MATERYQLSDGTVTKNAAEFRAHCLRLIDELIECGGQITIDRRDAPLALLAALGPVKPLPWGVLNGVEVGDDITEPLFTDEEVDAFLERELENVYGSRTERIE